MKKIKFPSAQTVLFIIAAFVALLTWLIPAGQFDRLSYNKDKNEFVKISQKEKTVLPATQKTLENLKIKIPLKKFTSGDIWKPISIPNTYKKLKSKPQGLIAFIQAPIKGIIQISDIMLLVLIIGGLIEIVNYTGAFAAGISWLSKALKGKEYILIVVVTSLIALGGTSFGMAEETIPFFPILIPVFLAAKYDALVPVACIFIGSSIGTMIGTTNPFSVIIASDAAGINWTTGMNGRIIFLLISLTICILYILRYAKRVKKDPSKSLIYNQVDEIHKLFPIASKPIKLTGKLRLILFVFISCFVIIGLARGITILMEDGLISDTLLYYSSHLTNGMNKGIFINAIFLIYNGLSFFISSSSGMAVLTMPIMAPLADGVNIGREAIVNAYQYGMGLFAFINPTGLILACLAIAKIGFDKWLKFVMPLVLILLVITMVYLTISVYI